MQLSLRAEDHTRNDFYTRPVRKLNSLISWEPGWDLRAEPTTHRSLSFDTRLLNLDFDSSETHNLQTSLLSKLYLG